eukprot:TRINITY_DN2342_c0_g1_i5.p1 TRINITY_DN2342_c0_g1~~TRINITY_DN2342_c0_g1_i5.p1  ORF type:complete len:134 (-),score=20.21 TRINITY_DN2342_c0_g1_i5:98-499(-)
MLQRAPRIFAVLFALAAVVDGVRVGDDVLPEALHGVARAGARVVRPVGQLAKSVIKETAERQVQKSAKEALNGGRVQARFMGDPMAVQRNTQQLAALAKKSPSMELPKTPKNDQPMFNPKYIPSHFGVPADES